MDILQAIKARHSVRSYTDKKIEGQVLDILRETIKECNRDSELNIQLCLNEPTAFKPNILTGMIPFYGKFKNVKNYVALVGQKDDMLEEKCGYYGEKIVLKAQQLGLNTCWVAVTFNKGKSKSAISIKPDEKLIVVIAIGYGSTQGVPHKVKPIEELGKASGEIPAWFKNGVEAAQLAPTAMNQQKFRFEWDGDTVHAVPGSGMYTKIDMGIAKYHFEIGAGDADYQRGW
jgi:hypothetical protein